MFLPVALVGVLKQQTGLADAYINRGVPESPMMMYLRRKEYVIYVYTLGIQVQSVGAY